MRIFTKKFILAALVIGLVCGAGTGCALVSVNAEKDRAQVLATINGTDIHKDLYDNAMAYTNIYYSANNKDLPTGSDLKTLKKNLYDSIIQNQVLAAKAKKDGVTVDEASAKAEGKTSYDSVKKEAAKKYDSILSDNFTNDKLFAAYMQDNAVTSAYADKALTARQDAIKKDTKLYLDESIGKINDTDLTHGEYSYYYVGQELTNYMSTGSALATDASTLKKTNDTIFNDIGLNRQLIKYCDDNKITISDSAISTAQQTLQYTTSMFFQDDSSLTSYLSSYNMDATQYKNYQKQEAKANAAKTAIQDKLTSDIQVKDSDIASYYNKHKQDYDTSTVSACHILTSDETLANEIYSKAKDCKSKDDFQKVMDEYKSNSSVTEAKDLGAFTYSQMTETFSKAAFALDKNSVSKPVKTDYGYHVIFVYDKKTGTVSSAQDNKDSITTAVKEEKGSEAYTKLENSLKNGIKIKVDSDIKSATEEYVDQLKTELNVTTHENVI